MKTFKVNVSWKMYGSYEIEANSEEEAKRIALDPHRVTPDNAEFLGDIQIDGKPELLSDEPTEFDNPMTNPKGQ